MENAFALLQDLLSRHLDQPEEDDMADVGFPTRIELLEKGDLGVIIAAGYYVDVHPEVVELLKTLPNVSCLGVGANHSDDRGPEEFLFSSVEAALSSAAAAGGSGRRPDPRDAYGIPPKLHQDEAFVEVLKVFLKESPDWTEDCPMTLKIATEEANIAMPASRSIGGPERTGLEP